MKDGTAGPKMNRILEAIKPEAVYFTDHNGQRGAVLIVDLPDASDVVAVRRACLLSFTLTIAAIRAIGTGRRPDPDSKVCQWI
ncbi:MAG: hypothetical protein ABSC18_00155 [Verrucomicrobiota bacterium]|jgi:hypothetical protein